MTTSSDRPSDGDRVVVVGPVIVDQYFLGAASRMDQTAAVPIVDVRAGSPFMALGGAGNAANSLAHLAMPVALVSVVGDDAGGRAFQEIPSNAFVKHYVAQDPHYQTPQKNRVFSNGRLVARFDIDDTPKANVEDKVVDMFMKCVDDVKPLAILISDYAKGICTERSLGVILRYARENNVKVIVDPSTRSTEHIKYYTGAYIITPNGREAMEVTEKPSIKAAAAELCKSLHVDHCIVTCGADGILLSSPDKEPIAFPALPAMLVDACGAGDTVAAALTYGVAVGMPMYEMIRFATTAGALSVERGGAGPVSLHQIHRRRSMAYGNGNKNIWLDYASLLRASARADKTVFGVANGIFDLLHPGHVSMLEQAAKKCGFLTVLLNSDESAIRMKRRPMQNYTLRAAALAALPTVHAVVKFNEDTPEESIRRLEPDLLIKGPELKGKEDTIPGAAFVKSTGGQVFIAELEYDTHTTHVIKRAREAIDDRKEASPPAEAGGGVGGAADAAE